MFLKPVAIGKCQKDHMQKQIRRRLQATDFMRQTAMEQGRPERQLESEARGLRL